MRAPLGYNLLQAQSTRKVAGEHLPVIQIEYLVIHTPLVNGLLLSLG
jgi:hypothetical protein